MVVWPAIFLSGPPPPLSFWHISYPVLPLCRPPCPANSCTLGSSRVGSPAGTSEQVLLSIVLLDSPARWRGRTAGLYSVWTNTCPLCHHSQQTRALSHAAAHDRWALKDSEGSKKRTWEDNLSISLWVRLLFNLPWGKNRSRKMLSFTKDWRVFNIKMLLLMLKLNFWICLKFVLILIFYREK